MSKNSYNLVDIMTVNTATAASFDEQKKLLIQEAYFKASRKIAQIVEEADSNTWKISKAQDQEEIDRLLAKIDQEY